MSLFENLAEKLQSSLKKLSGRGKLSEENIAEALREVRMALLEADVNFKVARDFTNRIRERAVGQEVQENLNPGQQVIKIVHEELTSLMGGENVRVNFSSKPPTVVMMVGLQGAGKTTHAAKLATFFKQQGRRPLLVAADVYRPAAIQQLEVLGKQAGVPVFALGTGVSPVEIAEKGVAHAKDHYNDLVIIDTAGRLHIDEELMGELTAIKGAVSPNEILLVIDAMTGQDAVNVAEQFHGQLAIDGVVLTKLDGDTRGGAALSVRAVTGQPIKFAGVGEKLDALEPFHPERMASRILGMGDVLTLIEKAQATFDEKQAKKMEQKLRSNEFNLEDFLEQFQQMKKLGSIESLLGMLPGGGQLKKAMADAKVDESHFKRIEAIIHSMTVAERQDPSLINGSRRKRIAAGSGTQVSDVNQLLRQFNDTKKMMKQMGMLERRMKKGKGRMPRLPFFG